MESELDLCIEGPLMTGRRLCFFKPWGAAEGPGQGCDHSVRALGKMTLAAMCRLLQEWRGGNGGERDFQN